MLIYISIKEVTSMKRKYKWVYEKDKIFFNKSLGIVIGIFFDEDWKKHKAGQHYQKIKLFTLVYRPKYNDFVRIREVDLPRKIQERYQDAYNTEQTIKELEDIGVYNYAKIEKVIDQYNEYQSYLTYLQYKNSLQDTNNEIYEKLLEVKSALEVKPVIEGKKLEMKPEEPQIPFNE